MGGKDFEYVVSIRYEEEPLQTVFEATKTSHIRDFQDDFETNTRIFNNRRLLPQEIFDILDGDIARMTQKLSTPHPAAYGINFDALHEKIDECEGMKKALIAKYINPQPKP